MKKRICLSLACLSMFVVIPGCQLFSDLLTSALIDATTPDDGRDLDADGLTASDERARLEERRLRELRYEGEIQGGYGYSPFRRFH